MHDPLPILVSSEWLGDRLNDDELIVIDASRHLPAANRDPLVEFEVAHIPGAVFLDLATLTDSSSPVPAAIPSPVQLADRLAELGVRPDDRIVLYDDSAVKTSARAWFILKAHGLPNAAILDGGMAKWRLEGRPLENCPSKARSIEPTPLSPAQGVVSKADVLANIETGGFQTLDARSADRVFGSGTDPVHGGENGRIPDSFNLPFGEVFNSDGTFKSAEDLRSAFEQAGIDLGRPIVTSCGSGVTASVLLFALHLIGKSDTALYDGSWQEWSADPSTPKAQGPE